MFLVCCVISQNHVVIWSFGLVSKKQSMYVTILPNFGVIYFVVVEICGSK